MRKSSPSRHLLMEVLDTYGPIQAPGGDATARLYTLMTDAGYRATNTQSLNQLLRSAEDDEVISRVVDVRGKKTFFIGLPDQCGPEPEVDLTDPPAGVDAVVAVHGQPPAVDLAALAAAVLDQALAARGEAAKAQESALEAQERAEKAEDALRHQSTDTSALEELEGRLAAQHETVRALTARACQAEEAVVVFRSRCEELDAEVAKLQRALKDSDDALAKAKSNGHNTYPFMEHLSAGSRRELAEIARLMTQPPTRRG